MTTVSIGTTLREPDQYAKPEREVWNSIHKQVEEKFPNFKNLIINLTWFGPQFKNSEFYTLQEYEEKGIVFDNLFLLSTVDPPYLNVTEIQGVKNSVGALSVYLLGNFDSPYQFNFFAVQLAENFYPYTEEQLILKDIQHVFVNYNRKPKPHRVEFVTKILDQRLDKIGVVTLGTDSTSSLLLTLDDSAGNIEHDIGNFGMPMVFYSLEPLNIWQHTFLYINAATENNPINDLFCQQDTFKPLIGLRPYVINGVQKTYRWLRNNGFKTFNHYWPHIDIENGNVHNTIIELLHWLKTQDLKQMYIDMLPDLRYNKQRFYEFSAEQKYKIENIF